MNRDAAIGLTVAVVSHALVLFGVDPPGFQSVRPQADEPYVEVELLAAAAPGAAEPEGGNAAPAVAPAPAPAIPLSPEPASPPPQPEFQQPAPTARPARKAVARPKKTPPKAATPAPEAADVGGTGETAATGDSAGTTAAVGGGTGTADHGTPQIAARFVTQVKPVYPSKAKRLGQEGFVVVSILVSTAGKIEKAEVTESSGFPLLDQAALEAVRRSRLRPAYVGNQPINSKVEAPYRFRLKDR